MDSLLFDQVLLIVGDTAKTESIFSLVGNTQETVEQGFSAIALAITGVLSLLGGVLGIKLLGGNSSSGVSQSTFDGVEDQLIAARNLLEQKESQLKTTQDNIEVLAQKYDSSQALLSVSKSRISELEQNYAELERDVIDYKDRLNRFNSKVSDFKDLRFDFIKQREINEQYFHEKGMKNKDGAIDIENLTAFNKLSNKDKKQMISNCKGWGYNGGREDLINEIIESLDS